MLKLTVGSSSRRTSGGGGRCSMSNIKKRLRDPFIEVEIREQKFLCRYFLRDKRFEHPLECVSSVKNARFCFAFLICMSFTGCKRSVSDLWVYSVISKIDIENY